MAVNRLIQWMLAAGSAVALSGCGNTNHAAEAPVRTEAPKTTKAEATKPITVDTRPVIAAFGDSLSAGYGLQGGESFPEVVQTLLDQGGYKYRVVNMGVSGDTTTDGVVRLSDVLAAKPSVVLLEFGGNDGLRGLPVSTTQENLARMTAELQKAGAKVVLAGMTLPRNYGPDYIASFEKVYLDIEKQYKTQRIPFLLEGVGGHPDLMQPDGIHPTAEGARIVARTVMQYLTPILKRG